MNHFHVPDLLLERSELREKIAIFEVQNARLLAALERLKDRVLDFGANGYAQEVAEAKAAIADARKGCK